MRQIVITAIVLLQASVLLHKSTCDVVFLNTQEESLAPQPSSAPFTPSLSPGKKKNSYLFLFSFLSIFFPDSSYSCSPMPLMIVFLLFVITFISFGRK